MQVQEVNGETLAELVDSTRVRTELDLGSARLILGFHARLGNVILVNGAEDRHALIHP